jgi:hypothetical protein
MKLNLRQPMIALLVTGTLVRCDCEETQEFLPGASYEPEEVLDFGPVSVTGEKTLDIEVLSNGRAALILSQLDFPGADQAKLGKFLFEGAASAPRRSPSPIDRAPTLGTATSSKRATTSAPVPTPRIKCR